jgi:predicted secreted protein
MAEAVKAEGLVIAVTNSSGGVYPFACAKDSTITISRDVIELAPKTNNIYREYIKGRQSFTISGSGLVKLAESNMQPITFFDDYFDGTDSEVVCYLDMIDTSNNYRVYQFNAIITELALASNVGAIGQYNYSMQGSGPFTELTVVDTYSVSSGKITARSTSTHKLVAVGFGGKWYYNYTVTDEGGGVFTITIGTAYNGVSVKAVYIAL